MSESHRLDARRFIAQMDRSFAGNDLDTAAACLKSWEAEARALSDARGLLAVRNEALGFYRRTGEKDAALAAVDECLALVERLGLTGSPSGATVLVNAATTRAFFGLEAEALPLYDRAAECFAASGKTDAYEYAALLNNRAGALYGLRRYGEAEADWRRAVAIMKALGGRGAEAAVSLVMLAHLTFDRDDTAFDRVEALLDEAWAQINAPDQPRDANYAYALQKCAPSFDYFQRPEAAEALREVAAEIYEGS